MSLLSVYVLGMHVGIFICLDSLTILLILTGLYLASQGLANFLLKYACRHASSRASLLAKAGFFLRLGHVGACLQGSSGTVPFGRGDANYF